MRKLCVAYNDMFRFLCNLEIVVRVMFVLSGATHM